MTDDKYDQPSSVTAKPDAVAVEGPDAVDVELTPDAADETGDRLIRKAREARIKANAN